MASECALCGIANGVIPAAVFWDDDDHEGVRLAREKRNIGFSVVIPKQHYLSYVFEVPESVMLGLVQATRTVAVILDGYFEDVGRTGLIFEGMGIDHLHAKLFPMHGTGDLTERWRPRMSKPQDRRYFERYEGFIASNLGPRRADPRELLELAAALKAHARST